MLRSLLVAGAVVWAVPGWSQTSVSADGTTRRSPWTDEAAQVRLHYGVSVRSGTEDDQGPGLTYSGVTPNDLSGSAWVWFLLGDHLGLTANFGREAFSLLENNMAVTSGGLVRFSVGPTGRVRIGPGRLEAAVEYAFHQLPIFGTLSPTFSAGTRHGILLAARGLVDLGPVTIEGRFEATPALASPGTMATSFGLGVGGGVRVQLFRTGSIKWGLIGEVMWHRDTITSAALTTEQSLIHAGGALDLQWKDPALDKEITTAELTIVVKGEAGPVPGAAVTVTGAAGPRAVSPDAQGQGHLADVEPGELTISATAAGYDSGEMVASVVAGDSKVVELTLQKTKPKVGGLTVKVISFEGKTPVVGANVELNGKILQTDATGSVAVMELAPGPVGLKVSMAGFNAGEDAASIVAGTTSEVVITLVPEKKRVPATLSGLVRNARGGKPVAAQLEIKELKQTITCDEAGQFSVQIPGGKYNVRITATGFVTQTKAVTVQDGDQAIFNLDLAPK